MNEIIFQIITSTPDGTGLATSGREMQQAFNGNFAIVKRYLDILLDVVSTQVSSENVRQFRVDTSTTPYKVYYTLDDETVENPEWIYLSANFSDLVGDPRDNIALKEELDSKADADVVTDIQGTVLNHTAQISDLGSRVTPLETITATHTTQINNINTVIPHTVRNPANTLLYLRYDAVGRKLEYSTDGNNWYNVADTGVSWTDITGNPEDSTALTRMINNLIDDAQQAQGGYATTQDLLDHEYDHTNPHQVTADQLGLGNVLNRLDALEGGESIRTDYSLQTYLNLPTSNISYYLSSHFIDQDAYSDWTLLQEIDETHPYTTTEGYPVTINVSPIDPVIYTGKNKFDKDNVVTVSNYYKNDNGVDTSSNGIGYTQTYYDVEPNNSYTFSGDLGESGGYFRVYHYDINKNWISRTAAISETPVTVQTPSNCYYIQFQYRMINVDFDTIQLEDGETAHSYEPFTNGKVVYLPKYYKLVDVTPAGGDTTYELYFSQNAKDYIQAHTI